AVEDENAREDDHLEHKSLGVADPAEDRKRQRSRPPVRRLDVALDGGVLRYERMERDISRHRGRGQSGQRRQRQQGPIHAPGVTPSEWRGSSDTVQAKRLASLNPVNACSPIAITSSPA